MKKVFKLPEKICSHMLQDISVIILNNNSIKYFRKDLTRMTMWLFILNAHFSDKKINIEDLARAIAPTSKVSKPSLRLILENAKHKGYIKFTKDILDKRSWNVEAEDITIKEFTEWAHSYLAPIE